jgi:Arc/MetJ family transcription regulator
MRTTVTIEKEMIDELRSVTGAKSKRRAVIIAISEYLRRKKTERIMQAKGKLSFDLTADEIRHYER